MVKLFEVDNFDDLYNKTALQNKLKDEILQVFNMIIQVNWSKALVSNFHVIIKADLVVKNVIQSKNKLKIVVNASEKTIKLTRA